MIHRPFNLLFLVVCIWFPPAHGDITNRSILQADADTLRAAFIINFARFTTWPVGANLSPEAEIHFCFFKAANILHIIDTSKTATIKGNVIAAKSIANRSNLADCHLIYIGEAAPYEITKILQATNKLPILSVSNLPGFATSGGMIELYQTDNTLKFSINMQSAEQSKLVFSSQLLKAAESVLEGTP